MKKIVTHFGPDLDAITSIWLIKRFFSGWGEAEILFAPAGGTLNDEPADSDPNILHVDTGMGKFDHHQLDEDTCAAKKVFEFLRTENLNSSGLKFSEDALERLVEVVNDVDHFQEVFWPNPTADFYDFDLRTIFDGLKLIWPDQDERIVEFGLEALDAVYKKFQNKVWAEELLKEEGVEFETQWGKGIGIETTNDEVIALAQKQGYKVVLRKDSKKQYVRIKARPEGINLQKEFAELKKADSEATWFFHPSGCMILNGSVKNPKTKPTKLSLKKIIEILGGGVR
ncbi:chromate resistance protein [Candidatus Microgenomates bacterium]|nr:chromate resistance protein [Candidatus Microgenomates bacterium]